MNQLSGRVLMQRLEVGLLRGYRVRVLLKLAKLMRAYFYLRRASLISRVGGLSRVHYIVLSPWLTITLSLSLSLSQILASEPPSSVVHFDSAHLTQVAPLSQLAVILGLTHDYRYAFRADGNATVLSSSSPNL